MSQCLRCSKPCTPTAVFCDECRTLLRNQLQEGPSSHAAKPVGSSLAVASSLSDYDAAYVGDEHAVPTRPANTAAAPGFAQAGRNEKDTPHDRITSPHPMARDPQTPQPPALASYANLAEQTLSRLNEAAQRIAEAESENPDRRGRVYPHASRLAPMRDISSDIQRESTPLPVISQKTDDEDGEREGNAKNLANHDVSSNGKGAIHAGALDMPDLWPWLDSEAEDKEMDKWANQTDPLLSRHIPTSAESARIEEDDIRRAQAEGIATALFPTHRGRHLSSRLRIGFLALAILAVVALIVDGILLSFAFGHTHRTANAPSGPPTLTLSLNSAITGQSVVLTISQFTPSTNVYLTHDIEEPVQTTTGSQPVPIGSNGSATVTIIVDDTWGPGFHLIVAEDTTTHYTASATLQITGEGPTPPPHLFTDKTSLDLGAAVQGANTMQHLILGNRGGGAITWAASSSAPWLLVSPLQGTFSKSQTIVVAAQRTNLRPRDYQATLTLSSNVGAPEQISVVMTVKPLPLNAGPVLSLIPAVMSFTTTDGNAQPLRQDLTINNPGSQTLYWSLTSSDPAIQNTQRALFHMLGSGSHWLGANVTSGVIAAGAAMHIQVIVQSQKLLPGSYLGTLVFSARGAVDGSQSVSIALTVQPHCGLLTTPTGLSFTAVQGHGNPGNQALSLSLTTSCDGSTVIWHAVPYSTGWLTVAPASGQLKGAASSVTSVGVNTGGLAPRTYSGTIAFVTGQSTQSVGVQLLVQPAPPPEEPVMAAAPLNLSFSNTQGQPNPSGQVVTITNNGGSQLKWSTSVVGLASTWLNAAPTGGNVGAGLTGQVTISVDTSGLTPGNYVGQVTLNGMDGNGHQASGSPQVVTVNLVLQPPCVLTQPSSSALVFSAAPGEPAPTDQTITFTGTGSCVWPLNWNTAVSPSAPWLALTPPTGSIKGSGESSSMQVGVHTKGLAPGTYSTKVSIAATDSSGAQAQESPQVFSVTLTVLQPCSLSSLPPTLAFTAAQGQSVPDPQSFMIDETGGCAFPVAWTAVGDANSSTWLAITPASGSDSGSGSTVSVGISQTNLAPGTYTGQITVSATDSNGVMVKGTPATITVTLTITSYTISGTIFACDGPPPSCTTFAPLPGATVNLVSNGVTIQTLVADALGSYSFTNVVVGTYTISAGGTDNNNINYVGSSAPFVVATNVALNVDVFPV